MSANSNARGLCENPDCGAFYDRDPVPHLDTYSQLVVMLCHQCAQSEGGDPNRRYVTIPPTEGTE